VLESPASAYARFGSELDSIDQTPFAPIAARATADEGSQPRLQADADQRAAHQLDGSAHDVDRIEVARRAAEDAKKLVESVLSK